MLGAKSVINKSECYSECIILKKVFQKSDLADSFTNVLLPRNRQVRGERKIH